MRNRKLRESWEESITSVEDILEFVSPKWIPSPGLTLFCCVHGCWNSYLGRLCYDRFSSSRWFRKFGKTVCSLQPPTHAGSSLADFSTLKTEAIHSSETSVHTRSTRRHILEDGILHSHRSENLKFYIVFCGGVRLSPLGTSATNWVTVPAPDDGRWWM
jgi:hypothetical protein